MADVYDPIETRPWQEVVERHGERLLEQLEYLAESSDYYRRKFAEWEVDPAAVTSIEDARSIPFTTKQDQRESQADPPPDRPLGEHQAVPTTALNRTISSSGTTGKPTYFGLTRRDRDAWNEVLKRFFYGTGIRESDTVIFGVGQTMVPGGTPYFEGLTQLGANAVPAGGGSTERLLSTTADLNADVFFSTVSHARYLIDRAPAVLGHDLAELPVDRVVVGGEPGGGNPEIREEIKTGWGVDAVRECMGLGDVVAGLWAECAVENGMHFVGQEYVHLELVEPDSGEPVALETGARGELVYTPLGREATPLLRFRSGDHAEITGVDCPCGRTSPTIRCIGRTDDMLIYKGMNVFPSAIRDVISEVDGASARIRIVVPDEETVQFDRPIPVMVAREADSDRPDADIADAAAESVRNRLQVRIAPEIVDRAETELSHYKTELLTSSPP